MQYTQHPLIKDAASYTYYNVMVSQKHWAAPEELIWLNKLFFIFLSPFVCPVLSRFTDWNFKVPRQPSAVRHNYSHLGDAIKLVLPLGVHCTLYSLQCTHMSGEREGVRGMGKGLKREKIILWGHTFLCVSLCVCSGQRIVVRRRACKLSPEATEKLDYIKLDLF